MYVYIFPVNRHFYHIAHSRGPSGTQISARAVATYWTTSSARSSTNRYAAMQNPLPQARSLTVPTSSRFRIPGSIPSRRGSRLSELRTKMFFQVCGPSSAATTRSFCRWSLSSTAWDSRMDSCAVSYSAYGVIARAMVQVSASFNLLVVIPT
jgi:hypothetical protein